MRYLQILPMLLFLATAACKNEPKMPAAALPTAPESPKPEVYLYAVTVDRLNLRDQPSQKGKVVAQFAEGDFVEGAGEVSPNKEEVTLRGIPYLEPYFKVTSTTPEQHNGWAFGGALLPVYAGPRATAPDLAKMQMLTAHLKTLDVKKVGSGKKAWDYVAREFANSKGTLADAAFILLEKFLFRMEYEGEMYNITEKVSWTEQDFEAVAKGTFYMGKYPATRSLAENGFRLETAEGTIFPVPDWAKMADFFAAKMTPPMKRYLEQSIAEQKEQLWSDGGIVIPLENVAERAVWWEKFNKENPYFVKSQEAKQNQNGILFVLLCGADNTPIYDYETGAITEAYKKAWASVLSKYPGTNVAKKVKEMQDLCASEGWKRTKKVEEHQAKLAEELYGL